MKSIDKIAKKLEDLIKDRIEELGLVKTGTLLKSINVRVSGDSLIVEAEDYYDALDDEYNITDYVLESSEFINYIEKTISDELEDEISK